MAVVDLFSSRQKRLRGEVPDVYVYNQVPRELRVQIIHVIRDMLGDPLHSGTSIGLCPRDAYREITKALAREYGEFRLYGESWEPRDANTELFPFLLSTKNPEYVLDVVELCARTADLQTRSFNYLGERNFNARVDDGITELNTRFRQHGVGYQYEEGEVLRIDSDLVHAHSVRPALSLLRTKKYIGPRDEFLSAHEHYRHGRHEEALVDALKSFESTMKAICDDNGWDYSPKATAKDLIKTCLHNELVDPFWQSHLAGLRSTLESAIATPRNKLAGHGQGVHARHVPPELVGYVLHMTASTIVFLIESSP